MRHNKTINLSRGNRVTFLNATPTDPQYPQYPVEKLKGEITYRYFTLSIPDRAPTAAETTKIMNGFTEYVGEHLIKRIIAPRDKLGPTFIILPGGLWGARGYKGISHKMGIYLLDMESAYEPIGG